MKEDKSLIEMCEEVRKLWNELVEEIIIKSRIADFLCWLDNKLKRWF